MSRSHWTVRRARIPFPATGSLALRRHKSPLATVVEGTGSKRQLPVRLRPCGLRRDSLRSFRYETAGLACPAVAREASEGWWGRQDSNLRSHEAADLQSAPFATRDTPPSQQRQQIVRKKWRRTEPSIWR